MFNSYFTSVNVDDDGTLPDFPLRAKASINLDAVQFSTDKIHEAIKKLKPKFTWDPEGFPAYLVKQLTTAFPGPLSLLFNSFLSVGIEFHLGRMQLLLPFTRRDHRRSLLNGYLTLGLYQNVYIAPESVMSCRHFLIAEEYRAKDHSV